MADEAPFGSFAPMLETLSSLFGKKYPFLERPKQGERLRDDIVPSQRVPFGFAPGLITPPNERPMNIDPEVLMGLLYPHLQLPRMYSDDPRFRILPFRTPSIIPKELNLDGPEHEV